MVITDSAADLHWLSGFLSFEPCPDVHADVRLGQVLAVQAATGHGVGHVTAELPVGSAGIYIRATGPVAERVDLRAGIVLGQFLSGSVALAEDQADAVQNVLPVRCVFLINSAGNG